ncbi:hypothetical protein EVC62_02110 [Salinicola endophyticus]|uniref:Uncharacterized protein n=1 Tax=Salinicola endophyticus TaxID=1949083 RepID=A0ABY8FFQ7_9GAMM|nr:hypothetical protein [Salinicola endophyticus]WFF40388.1 hypothetical protein EVC62_02110 [Salinicola endophyticus]
MPESEFFEGLKKCVPGDDVSVSVPGAIYSGEISELGECYIKIKGKMILCNPHSLEQGGHPSMINNTAIPFENVTAFTRDGVDYEKENGV